MQKYFNVPLEFDYDVVWQTINHSIESGVKGYVGVVDANVLTIAQHDLKFREILENSLINTCDGSSIAMFAGKLHKKKFRALNGPEVFSAYIEKPYLQLLLGSNEETSNKIKEVLRSKGLNDSHLQVMPLPFNDINSFDYAEIAQRINEIGPSVIWVSLGAPKQEYFMSKILPLLNKGVMFAIGAAFKFYINEISLPTVRVGSLKFIWISRIISEPKKQLSRVIPYIKILPSLVWEERKKILSAKKNKRDKEGLFTL